MPNHLHELLARIEKGLPNRRLRSTLLYTTRDPIDELAAEADSPLPRAEYG